MSNKNYCLIVEDDFVAKNLYKVIMESAGINNLSFCETIAETRKRISEIPCACILLDINLPDGSGLNYLEWHRENHPDIPVIIVTGDESEDVAKSCSKLGAYDFFVKPFNNTRLLTSLRNALEHFEMKREISGLAHSFLNEGIGNKAAFSPIITKSPQMHRIFKYIEAVSPSNQPLLIQGESGTGKELIAKAIHKASGLTGKMISVNVSGLDDTMFSDSLFGHEKGAYTGAAGERKGFIQKASGGTLFLDEIGDLELKSQVKLLRLLQEKEYYPLGSDQPRISSARIVTATNVDLTQKVKEGIFRKDLFYRLRSHTIQLPPLRERRQDIIILFNHFIEKISTSLKMERPILPVEANDIILGYPFPGNVRELEGISHDLVYRGSMGPLTVEDLVFQLDPDLAMDSVLPPQNNFEKGALEYSDLVEIYGHFPTLDEVENNLMIEALKFCQNNQSSAAKMLGISQSKVSRWMSSHPNVIS